VIRDDEEVGVPSAVLPGAEVELAAVLPGIVDDDDELLFVVFALATVAVNVVVDDEDNVVDNEDIAVVDDDDMVVDDDDDKVVVDDEDNLVVDDDDTVVDDDEDT